MSISAVCTKFLNFWLFAQGDAFSDSISLGLVTWTRSNVVKSFSACGGKNWFFNGANLVWATAGMEAVPYCVILRQFAFSAPCCFKVNFFHQIGLNIEKKKVIGSLLYPTNQVVGIAVVSFICANKTYCSLLWEIWIATHFFIIPCLPLKWVQTHRFKTVLICGGKLDYCMHCCRVIAG